MGKGSQRRPSWVSDHFYALKYRIAFVGIKRSPARATREKGRGNVE